MPSELLMNVPPSLKQISHLVKIANSYSNRDVVLYYWCIFKAVEDGMKLDNKSTEARDYLMKLLTLLEKIKTDNHESDSIRSPNLIAQAYVEDQAQKLFQYAESQDAQGVYNQKVIQAFFTAGFLFEVLTVFGEVDEHIQSAKKYAQWRATHIHQCLKNGENPTPGQKAKQPGEKDFPTPQPQPGGGGDDYPTNQISSMRIDGGGGGGGAGSSSHVGGGGSGGFPPQTTNFPVYPQPPPRQQQYMGGVQLPPSGSYGMTSATSAPAPLNAQSSSSMEEFIEAKKLVKYAMSALDYEDAKTAVDQMQKAIALLEKKHM